MSRVTWYQGAREDVGESMKLLLTTVKSENPRSPLALNYLYGVIADSPIDLDLQVFDTIELDNDIYENIVRGQYNVVYFHCDEYNEYRICNLIEMVKKATPSTAIVVGGVQVSFDTREFMLKNPCVDYVIRGEGETVMFNFLKTMLTYDFDFAEIAGLAYRENEEVIINPFDATLPMEELPFPYEKTELSDTGIVYYESIRGTADRTVYKQFLPDSRVRTLPLNRICTELRYFLVKGVEKVVFLDTFFNYNSERAYRIFEYIINNDNGTTLFELNIDGDNLDEETIRLLSEAREGLFIFNIDIASTNAETLAAIGRKENVYQMMYNVTKLLQRGNIKINIYISAGLPLETEQLFARSFNKAYGLGEGKSLIVNTINVPKGSVLKSEADKYGYVYRSTSPYEVIGSAFMPAPDLIKIKTLSGIAEKYINENFITSISRMLNDTGLKPYDFFKDFSDFILTKKLGRKTNKLENRFRILYAFAEDLYDDLNDTLKLQILMEIIHEDLENALSPEAVKKFERKGWEIEA